MNKTAKKAVAVIWQAQHMPHGEALSRSFYAKLGAEGLRRRSRPKFDAAITEAVAAYLGERQRVLDAGFGYGRIAIALAARGHQVSGLDLSAPLLTSAGSSPNPGCPAAAGHWQHDETAVQGRVI